MYRFFGWGMAHRDWTHSIFLVPILGFMVAMACHWVYQKFWLGFAFGCLAAMFHPLLDMGSSLTGPRLFAPFSQARFDWPFHFLPVAEVRIGS